MIQKRRSILCHSVSWALGLTLISFGNAAFADWLSIRPENKRERSVRWAIDETLNRLYYLDYLRCVPANDAEKNLSCTYKFEFADAPSFKVIVSVPAGEFNNSLYVYRDDQNELKNNISDKLVYKDDIVTWARRIITNGYELAIRDPRYADALKLQDVANSYRR